MTQMANRFLEGLSSSFKDDPVLSPPDVARISSFINQTISEGEGYDYLASLIRDNNSMLPYYREYALKKVNYFFKRFRYKPPPTIKNQILSWISNWI